MRIYDFVDVGIHYEEKGDAHVYVALVDTDKDLRLISCIAYSDEEAFQELRHLGDILTVAKVTEILESLRVLSKASHEEQGWGATFSNKPVVIV